RRRSAGRSRHQHFEENEAAGRFSSLGDLTQGRLDAVLNFGGGRGGGWNVRTLFGNGRGKDESGGSRKIESFDEAARRYGGGACGEAGLGGRDAGRSGGTE